MKRLIALFFIVIWMPGIHSQNSLLSPEVYTLDNGLTVYLNSDPTASSVFGLVAVRAGSKNDPADATGLAHYQEHMLFKGTNELGTTDWENERTHIENIFRLYDKLHDTADETERKKIQAMINQESVEANKYVVSNELDKLLRNIGSTGLNAFTSTDMTVYFNEFPPGQIEKWLEIYSHRFINPVFRGFQAELEVVYEEFNMYNDMFIMPLLEKFNKSFFKNHPYGQQSTIGTLEHLKNPSLTKMYEFFKTWYVPENMALILSGNFSIKEVKPLIEIYFGRWINESVPDFPAYEEQAFQGRELIEVKMSPIKLGILGFRTAPAKDEDKYVLDIIYRVLSNSGQTGILDQLVLDNKLMAAQAIQMPYKDHGAFIILIVPKIIGQSLEDAEKLVLNELTKLKEGKFDPEIIEAVKKEIYTEYTRSMESHTNICILLAQSFVNEEPAEKLLTYPERILQISQDEISIAFNKYFGSNYLAFFSKMGFPKKIKIEKPGYEPVVDSTGTHSEYYSRITDWQPDPVKFEQRGYHENVEKRELSYGKYIFFSENRVNDVFSLKIRFYMTQAPGPLASLAVGAMNLAGTAEQDIKNLKRSFSLLGVSYYFELSGDFIEISLEGMESGLPDALRLLLSLIANPVLEESKIELLYEEAKAMRKLETADADGIAEMLYQYVVYGKYSSYINRLSLKEIKNLTPEKLISDFKVLLYQPYEIHYTGSRSSLDLLAEMMEMNNLNDVSSDIKKRYELTKNSPETNKIIFVNKPNTLQSKIYFYTLGESFNPKEEAVFDMFNEYFGGGFSGLVLKEIREFRSMAYSAGAWFNRPLNLGSQLTFTGYIGTQADKTIDAIDIFMKLLRNMPEKPDEASSIRDYLILSQFSNKPDFRNVTTRYSADLFLGWNEDPVLMKTQLYPNIHYEDIQTFYQMNLQTKPVFILVVADKKRINPKDLEKFGKVETIKVKDLYVK